MTCMVIEITMYLDMTRLNIALNTNTNSGCEYTYVMYNQNCMTRCLVSVVRNIQAM